MVRVETSISLGEIEFDEAEEDVPIGTIPMFSLPVGLDESDAGFRRLTVSGNVWADPSVMNISWIKKRAPHTGGLFLKAGNTIRIGR
jgi:hypothetical protein